tara:strand:+ start:78 stop:503 length:426 start_codon:yes stop_codon:yes gene_type:complete
MALNHPPLGPNATFAYQASGIPYVSSSANDVVPANNVDPLTPYKHEFPFVTRFFQVEDLNNQGLRVGFSASGSMGINYFTVAGNAKSEVYELRTKDLFFVSNTTSTTGVRIIAGLTTISRDHFPTLTGSLADGTAAYQGIG